MCMRILPAVAGVLTFLSLCFDASLLGQDRPPQVSKLTFESSRFVLSPEVIADEDGNIRLAHSVLVADEMGATDYRQSETLSDRVWARKCFVLDSADVTSADLILYGSAKLVSVNGKPLGAPEPLGSSGWAHVKIPIDRLIAGENEVILSGGGSLAIEPTRQPGRSAKSKDGGRTWSDESLGAKDNQSGEYLVRLRVGRYAPRGWAVSPVVDLWTGEVAVSGKLLSATLSDVSHAQAEGTKLVASIRTGSAPTPDAKTWTGWADLDRPFRPESEAQGHRWAQLRLDLRTTRPQASPRLPRRFELTIETQPDFVTTKDRLEVKAIENGPLQTGSVPFVYQEPSPRLRLLRERYQLDKVIAPGKTEMEQLMLLRYWVRNQWHTAWGSHPAAWMPPWDALVILESKDQPDCLTMCTHYAAVFCQCCLALGWNARHCILDHHCVAEVYVDQHHKWVMMDAGNSAERADVGLHFEKDGVPLSALELHLAEKSGKTDGITVCFTPAALVEKVSPLCRPAPAPKPAVKVEPRPVTIPLGDLKKFPVCQLVNYRRYAFPARNNYLHSLVPGELYQGWSNYFYDGYCWVGDSPDAPQLSPEYSRHLPPSRPQDVDWKLNESRIHLSRTSKSGEVRVDVETMTPNLLRLERRDEEKEAWQATLAGFVWKLKPGVNILRIRGVNQWERGGREARVEVRWTPTE